MSDRVQITIEGRETASRAFQQVASGADRMDQSLDRAEQSANRFSRAGAALGAVIGATSGILADSARAAAEAEVSQERLRAAIEASGDTYEEYADQLEAAGEAAVEMGFDDEEAADSIARLTTATGDAGAAIENLGLIMDIARGRGISLADATRIVEAVETGRMETLRRLGIVLDENATKQEALAELQRRYAGQAEAYAETTAGSMDRIRVQLGNLQESIGEHAGGLQSILILLPGLSAGYTAAAAGVGAFTRAMLGSNVSAAAAARSLGPLGILGAVAALAVAYDQFGRDSHMDEVWKDFEEGAKSFDDVLASLAANGERDLLALGDASNAIVDDMLADFDRLGELGEIVETGEATAAQRAEFEALSLVFRDLTADAEDFSQVESSIARILTNTGEGAALVTDQLDRLNEQFLAGNISAEAWMVGVNNLAGSFEVYDRAATNATETTRQSVNTGELWGQMAASNAQQAKEWTEALNELQTEAARVEFQQSAEAVTATLTATTNALSNAFRVIVGNTDAIAQQSQAVDDWAHELRILGDDHRNLNTLLEDGRISQQQYNDAVQATVEINRANQMVQEAVLEIQAEQAPVLGRLAEAQAQYIDSLADAPAQQQALALAYMDTATAAQAVELAQIAMSQAPGFEGLIEGAIAANPYLELILEDMGIISRGAEGELIINTTGQTELESLTSAIESLEDTIVSVFVGVEVDSSDLDDLYQKFPVAGMGPLGTVGGGGGGSGMAFNIAVTADTSDADARIDETTSKLDEWDGATATGELLADNGDATNKIEQSQNDLRSWGAATGTGRVLADSSDATSKMAAAQGSLRAWGSSSASARVNATNNASGVIAAVSSQLAALNGRTATTYINTVYTTIGSPVGLGGVAGYAAGGVVAEMAEWGPELLHFPNGGVAMAHRRGLYAVPQGTYVDTAPATAAKASMLGGLTVNVHVGGNVIGVDDLAAEVSTKIVPAIQRAYQQHARGYA